MRRRLTTHHSLSWLALVVILVILVILPPYVSKGFDILQILALNSYILTHSVRHEFSILFPFANLLMITALIAVLILGAKWARFFSMYIFLAYTASGILQNISISDEHGLAISTSTMLLTFLVAYSWLQELLYPQNDFSYKYPTRRAVLLMPLALLAIWQPVNTSTLLPEFNLRYFLSTGSSLTFCMTSIVSLSVLLIYYPYVNMDTLRITSAVGLLIGIGNLWLEFIYLPGFLWVGVLHIPLVVLSAVGLYFSSRDVATAAA
jgi:hypothetical protein